MKQKAIKRNRYKHVYVEGDYDDRNSYVRPILINEHVPMKKESKVLRRLMSQTGLTEPQLREHKKYRVMLSQTQKSPRSKYDHFEPDRRYIKLLLNHAIDHLQATSPWDVRVQGQVLKQLTELAEASLSHPYPPRNRLIDLFNSQFRRKDKAFV